MFWKSQLRVVCVTVLAASTLLWADDDRRQGEGKKLYEAQLVRIADLVVPQGNPAGQQLGPAFAPNGVDPLDEGSVEVRDEGRVEIRLRGAAPMQGYSAYVCLVGFGPAGCTRLGDAGALATDEDGNARKGFDLPKPGSQAAFFVVTRAVNNQPTNEYVSGWRSRSPNGEEMTEMEVAGSISSIDAANRSFRLAGLNQDIFVNGATEFKGSVRGFSDLKTGMRVEVEATLGADGKLTAREIKAKPAEPPRGRGHGHD